MALCHNFLNHNLYNFRIKSFHHKTFAFCMVLYNGNKHYALIIPPCPQQSRYVYWPIMFAYLFLHVTYSQLSATSEPGQRNITICNSMTVKTITTQPSPSNMYTYNLTSYNWNPFFECAGEICWHRNIFTRARQSH